jgi:hypothetical protein
VIVVLVVRHRRKEKQFEGPSEDTPAESGN